jgi:hypothetical protein
MHALVVRVTIHNADRTREVLNSQVVPQVSVAAGFKAGYWTWSTGRAELNGLSMIVFDSEENARAAGDRIGARGRRFRLSSVGLGAAGAPTWKMRRRRADRERAVATGQTAIDGRSP